MKLCFCARSRNYISYFDKFKCDHDDMSSSEYKFKHLVFHLAPVAILDKDRPFTKSGHGIVCRDDSLLTYEYDPEINTFYQAIHQAGTGFLRRYNYIAGRWERINCQNILSNFSCSKILLSGNMIIIHGGIGDRFSNSCYYETYIGNLSYTNQDGELVFENVSYTNKIPNKGYNQPIVMDEQYIYSVDGISDYKNEMDVCRLDLSTKKWEYLCEAHGLHPKHIETYGHNLAYYNNGLYMFGATKVIIQHSYTYLDTFEKIQVFDLSSNTWIYRTTSPGHHSSNELYPENRHHYGFAQCVSQPNFIYICGGYNKINLFSDIWRLDLITLQWCNLTPCKLPNPTILQSCNISPSGRLYYYNGKTSLSFRGRRRVCQSDNVYFTWLRVPTLKEICWEAMLHYYKNQMLESSVRELENLGLPLDYYKNVIKARTLLEI